jgi:hypothetical protein
VQTPVVLLQQLPGTDWFTTASVNAPPAAVLLHMPTRMMYVVPEVSAKVTRERPPIVPQASSSQASWFALLAGQAEEWIESTVSMLTAEPQRVSCQVPLEEGVKR